MKRWIFPLLGVAAGAACAASVGCGGRVAVDPDAGSAGPTPAAVRDGDGGGGAKTSNRAFCDALADKPRFCEDFDEVGPGDAGLTNSWDHLRGHWDIATRLNGELKADVGSATSPPAAFEATTVALKDGETANVHLRKTVSGKPDTSLRLEASLRVSGPALTRGTVAVVTLDLSPKHLMTLYLRDDGGGPSLEEIGESGTRRHVVAAVPTPFRWTRVRIDLDLVASRVRVRYDERAVLDEDTYPINAVDPTLRIGAVYVIGAADPFEVRFDDVVLDF